MTEGYYSRSKPKKRIKRLTADEKTARALLVLITKRTNEVADLRDKIRDELVEYEALLESMTEANELMLQGKEYIEDAIDEMSKYA